jgi:SAM-dependent methyltransferase
MATKTDNWFETWFDTEYYHQLYQHRDEEEARVFIATMVMYLELRGGQRVLDLACGKGRHSRELQKHSLEVVGIDLSKNSIEEAKIYESDEMVFDIHDMRKPLTKFGKFDAVFNIFTSFGYFDTKEEDVKSIKNVVKALVPQGQFVQDYINANAVIPKLPETGNLRVEDIEFSWEKRFENGYIIKDITVIDKGHSHRFQERVKMYSIEELKQIHQEAGLTVVSEFGAYELDPYESDSSPRIILVSEKK